MRYQLSRLIRWMDNHTLVAFNPAMGFRQTPSERAERQT